MIKKGCSLCIKVAVPFIFYSNGAVSGAFVHMFNAEAHLSALNPAEQRQLERRFSQEEGLMDVSALFIPIGRILAGIGNTFKAAFQYAGLAPYSSKIVTQMGKGGWTEKKVFNALKTNGIEATGKINSATRYVNPSTGKSIIIDNMTKELFHAGRKSDFKY